MNPTSLEFIACTLADLGHGKTAAFLRHLVQIEGHAPEAARPASGNSGDGAPAGNNPTNRENIAARQRYDAGSLKGAGDGQSIAGGLFPGKFEISCADPAFDPYREVWINGWAFAPVGRGSIAGANAIRQPTIAEAERLAPLLRDPLQHMTAADYQAAGNLIEQLSLAVVRQDRMISERQEPNLSTKEQRAAWYSEMRSDPLKYLEKNEDEPYSRWVYYTADAISHVRDELIAAREKMAAQERLIERIVRSEPLDALLDDQPAEWAKGGYVHAHEEIEDMARIGRALMDAIADVTKAGGMMEGWTPADSPAEIVVDMANRWTDELVAARSEITALQAPQVRVFNVAGLVEKDLAERYEEMRKNYDLVKTYTNEQREVARDAVNQASVNPVWDGYAIVDAAAKALGLRRAEA